MGEEERPEYHFQAPIRKDPVSGIPLPILPKPDLVVPNEASLRKLLNPEQSLELGLPGPQGGENQSSGIHPSPEALAHEWNILKEGPKVAWGPPLEISKAEFSKAFEQGRITQEEYDEELEDRRLAEERKCSQKRDLGNA
jgi:hypothetical protein